MTNYTALKPSASDPRSPSGFPHSFPNINRTPRSAVVRESGGDGFGTPGDTELVPAGDSPAVAAPEPPDPFRQANLQHPLETVDGHTRKLIDEAAAWKWWAQYACYQARLRLSWGSKTASLQIEPDALFETALRGLAYSIRVGAASLAIPVYLFPNDGTPDDREALSRLQLPFGSALTSSVNETGWRDVYWRSHRIGRLHPSDQAWAASLLAYGAELRFSRFTPARGEFTGTEVAVHNVGPAVVVRRAEKGEGFDIDPEVIVRDPRSPAYRITRQLTANGAG